MGEMDSLLQAKKWDFCYIITLHYFRLPARAQTDSVESSSCSLSLFFFDTGSCTQKSPRGNEIIKKHEDWSPKDSHTKDGPREGGRRRRDCLPFPGELASCRNLSPITVATSKFFLSARGRNQLLELSFVFDLGVSERMTQENGSGKSTPFPVLLENVRCLRSFAWRDTDCRQDFKNKNKKNPTIPQLHFLSLRYH